MVLIQAKVSTGLYAKTIEVQHTILVSTESKSLSLECPDLVVANQVYECVFSGFTGPNDVFKYTLDNNEIDTRLLPSEFTSNLVQLLTLYALTNQSCQISQSDYIRNNIGLFYCSIFMMFFMDCFHIWRIGSCLGGDCEFAFLVLGCELVLV